MADIILLYLIQIIDSIHTLLFIMIALISISLLFIGAHAFFANDGALIIKNRNTKILLIVYATLILLLVLLPSSDLLKRFMDLY